MLCILHDTPFYYCQYPFSLLHILIASDQFVNIVYMLLLYLIYLIGLSE